MSYKSPIEIIYGDMTHKLENEVFTVVQNIGINIDKDELIKALQYDRNQYEKGYADAMMNAVPVVRCKDCKYCDLNPYPGYFYCDALGMDLNADEYPPDMFFCADGER